MYLRQVDAPGVDTKFIERHKGVLTELLDVQLDPSRVDTVAPDFAERYGFLRGRVTSGSGWPGATADSPSCRSASASSPPCPRASPAHT